MKYILDGNEKDVTNVIKEQRVRMGRGVISPLSPNVGSSLRKTPVKRWMKS